MNKRLVLSSVLSVFCLAAISQTNRPIVTETITQNTNQSYQQAFVNLSSNLILTGFLSDKITELVPFSKFTGHEKPADITVLNYAGWRQLYKQISESQVVNKIPNLDNIYDKYSVKATNIKQFNPIDPAKNVLANIQEEEFTPISVIDIDYNKIRDDAFQKGLLKKTIQTYEETPLTATNSPYVTKSTFAASVLNRGSHNGNSVNFVFDESFYFTNKDLKNCTFEIDFGDGGGFQPMRFGDTKIVSYSSVGTKRIQLRKTEARTDDSGITEYIKTLSIVEYIIFSRFAVKPTSIIPVEVNVPSNYPNGGVKMNGYAYLYTSDGSQNIKNPIILCEGFDPKNETRWPQLYELLNRQNLVECLKTAGYDIILLNLCEGGAPIEANAYLFKKLIEHVNSIKTTVNKNIIIGPSMGGLISRYALAYMEQQGIDHQTRLFVSFDSPHKGANIPIGAQYFVKFFASSSDAADIGYSKLRSSAGRQMLIYNAGVPSTDPTSDWKRTEFKTNLATIGYPGRLRKVAIANGAGNGYAQRKNDGTALVFNDQILEYDFYSLPMDLVGNSWSVPYGGLNLKIFEGEKDYPLPFWDSSWDVYMTGYDPVDNAPGGTTNVTEVIAEGDPYLLDIGGDLIGLSNIYTDANKASFISTISALDIDESFLFHNIDSDSDIMSKTPFDSIYFPLSENEEHVYISAQTVDWIKSELVPDHIILDGSEGWDDGDIRAGNTITMLPGYKSANNAVLTAFILPLGSCPISSAKTNNTDNVNPYFEGGFGAEIDESESSIMIYPNPNEGQFYVESKSEEIITSIVVTNMIGQVVYKNSNLESNKVSVDLSNQSQGVYTIAIVQNGKVHTERIVKN